MVSPSMNRAGGDATFHTFRFSLCSPAGITNVSGMPNCNLPSSIRLKLPSVLMLMVSSWSRVKAFENSTVCQWLSCFQKGGNIAPRSVRRLLNMLPIHISKSPGYHIQVAELLALESVVCTPLLLHSFTPEDNLEFFSISLLGYLFESLALCLWCPDYSNRQ